MSQSRNLRFIITGCGHTGTGYCSQLLRSAGVKCGHEGIFDYTGVKEEGALIMEADASWAAAALLDHPLCRGARVVHVVRNPLDTIRSLVQGGTSTPGDEWAATRISLPNKGAVGQLEFQCAYYLEWNGFIRRVAPESLLFRVEDGIKLLDLLGLEQVTKWDNPMYNCHVINRKPWDWEKIPEKYRERLQAMGARYGY